ncbi:MAG: 5'-nucleotidase C-terminal domain-containing protein [Bacteroidetes bacterium]|nr:5'-nucleotidase C-terminal domain-containing protein [Bacteroidota bacterium]
MKRIHLLYASLMMLASCGPAVRYQGGAYTRIDSLIAPDSVENSRILPYRNQLAAEMNEVIGFADSALVSRRPEGSLGNFMADILFQRAQSYMLETNGFPVHACVINAGGIRASMPKGPVTVGQIYSIAPFENELVVLRISGAKMAELLNYIAKKGGEPVSNIHLLIRKDGTWAEATIANKPFDSRQNYYIATNDYLAQGGDKMSFFNQPLERYDLRVKVRDAIIDYLHLQHAEGVHITPPAINRLEYVE